MRPTTSIDLFLPEECEAILNWTDGLCRSSIGSGCEAAVPLHQLLAWRGTGRSQPADTGRATLAWRQRLQCAALSIYHLTAEREGLGKENK